MLGHDIVKKRAFIQNRADLEVTRLLRQGPSVSSVVQQQPSWRGRPPPLPVGGFFDRDGEDDDKPARRLARARVEGAGHRGRARVEEAPEAEAEEQEEDAEVARQRAEGEDVAARAATPAAPECPKS